ncbi:hypothetical protein YPPY11_2691, partial [Yersinia pestis PY-11]
MAFFIF